MLQSQQAVAQTSALQFECVPCCIVLPFSLGSLLGMASLLQSQVGGGPAPPAAALATADEVPEYDGIAKEYALNKTELWRLTVEVSTSRKRERKGR